MSARKPEDTKTTTISVSLTEAQKELFKTAAQGIPFSVVLRQLIQYSLRVEENAGQPDAPSIESLIACYERLPTSREVLMGMKTVKSSVHLTERDSLRFKDLANNRVRRPANLLGILADLFINNVITKDDLW
jgi:hypothetical protein